MKLHMACVGAAAAALMAFSSTAEGAVTVIGTGLAADCSQAAQRGKSDRASLTVCNHALDDETLSRRDRAGTYVNRGVMRLRRREFDAALVDFDQATATDNTMGEAYANRGAVFVAQRRYQDGLDQINRAIELGIDDMAKAYYNRAMAYEGLEDARSAYLDYQQALTLKPGWDLPQQQLLRFSVTRR